MWQQYEILWKDNLLILDWQHYIKSRYRALPKRVRTKQYFSCHIAKKINKIVGLDPKLNEGDLYTLIVSITHAKKWLHIWMDPSKCTIFWKRQFLIFIAYRVKCSSIVIHGFWPPRTIFLFTCMYNSTESLNFSSNVWRPTYDGRWNQWNNTTQHKTTQHNGNEYNTNTIGYYYIINS